MGANLRSWWQKLRQRRIAIIVTIAIAVVAIVLIMVGYSFNWAGFNGYTQVSTIHTLSGPMAGTVTRTEAYQPGKTLWDWLQLLIIPLALAIIAVVFQLANARTERQIAKQRYEQDQQIAKQRYEQDQQIALDKQQGDLLQAYLDRMSELLLKEKLRSSEDNAEVRNVARMRTITVLTQLDARRIGYVFTFLRGAGLMSTTSNSSVVILKDADLRSVNWSQAYLFKADLWGAILSKADLSRATLGLADLSYANLSGANLSGAMLWGATLSEADLSKASLSGAMLWGATLLSEADLKAAYGKTNLSDAGLSLADWVKTLRTDADFSNANLEGANLNKAWVTKEQLAKAASLKGATMPDGSVHP